MKTILKVGTLDKDFSGREVLSGMTMEIKIDHGSTAIRKYI
jgi:hypothetical protein